MKNTVKAIQRYNLTPKILFLTFFALLTTIFLVSTDLKAYSDESEIKDLIISKEDIPKGMSYGVVPKQAKHIIKNNPWIMDRTSIKKLAKAIYPGANEKAIEGMLMVILTENDNPYGDDVVYYVFSYQDIRTANVEFTKLKEVSANNKTRTVLLTQGKRAILFIADDEGQYQRIQKISGKLAEKMGS